MEGKKLVIIFTLLFSSICFSQSNESIYIAYTTGQMDIWKKQIDHQLTIKNKTEAQKIDLINFLYGYIGWSLGKGYDDDARYYIDQYDKLIVSLELDYMDSSLIYCYKSAQIGFEIGLAFYKAPFIGPKSIKYADKSLELDSTNAFAFIQKGHIKFYTPKIFGGSKEEALDFYQKAFELMVLDYSNSTYNWNNLNIYTILITAYLEVDNYMKALYYSNKVLEIEPNFKWVKETLRPQILKEIEKNG